MSKVLILSASPRRKGNSSQLCDEFLRGAQEAGHEVEKMIVSHRQIAGCMGCNACMRNGGSCIQKDEMREIRDKMLAADVIVLASPVYFYSMDAQMKTIIDRCYAFYQRMEGKTFYYILTMAAANVKNADTAIAGLRGFTRCVPDSKEGGYVVATNVWDTGAVQDSPALSEAYELGKSVQ